MCGIAGAYACGSEASRVDVAALRAMREHMTARGPDGAGEWYSEDQRTGLMHRRLSIIDLSERGAQPMMSANGQLVIVFNGEIYNYRELRRDLEIDGCVFRSDSDTEVLLHLYAREGEGMLVRLRGMFAFSIWDALSKKLFLARDTFGIKPLYYAEQAGTLYFASQVQALLTGNVDKRPDPAGMAGFLLWGSVPEPWTMFKGIRALPAGHFMTVEPGRVSIPQAYKTVSGVLRDACVKPTNCDRASALEEIADAVRDSVRAHHIADVPVGVFLSAGLDSSMIALATSANSDALHRLRTVTLGFREYEGGDGDEVPSAEAVASMCYSEHVTDWVQKADFEGAREALLQAMDQPSIDGVNTWFVARAARAAGLKVALSGLGGDEVFASYPSFADVPRMVGTFRRFARPALVGRTLRYLSAPVAKRVSSPKYAGLVEYGGTMAGAYLLRRALYMPWELAAIMGAEAAAEGLTALKTIERLNATIADIPIPRLAITALEMEWYMRHQLLRDADWAGMAHSLEIRVPFVDLMLLERVAPCFARHPDITKTEVAKATAPTMPLTLLNRPKTGFTVPVREWMIGGASMPSRERGLRGWAQFCGNQYAAANRSAG
jgi:asparagine synthase (glutamine-hydrolysing)